MHHSSPLPTHIVRGARILQELSSLTDLERNIAVAFPRTKKREHALSDVTLGEVEFIPYKGMNMLHIRSTTTSKSGHQHKQALQILKTTFLPSVTDTCIVVTDTNGEEFYIEPIAIADHNTKVRCDCLDFYHRFATYNFVDKSLMGSKPKPYVRKTTTYPSVNPTRVPGICKHLLKLTEKLHTDGLIYV
jgi:hypothetical protein